MLIVAQGGHRAINSDRIEMYVLQDEEIACYIGGERRPLAEYESEEMASKEFASLLQVLSGLPFAETHKIYIMG